MIIIANLYHLGDMSKVIKVGIYPLPYLISLFSAAAQTPIKAPLGTLAVLYGWFQQKANTCLLNQAGNFFLLIPNEGGSLGQRSKDP